MTPEQMIDFILAREGGFVNDPKDPGGATNYGISFRFLSSVHPDIADIDGDGDVDIDDILALSPENARTFYKQWFYDRMGIDKYVPTLGAAVLDTGVNMGRSRAGKLLQRALNKCGENLIVDGIVGQKTLNAVDKIDTYNLLRAFLLERIIEYSRLCRNNNKLRRFFYGWIERVNHLYIFCLME
jgi:lysozyme family protein